MNILSKIQQIDSPTLVLENKNFNNYGALTNYSSFRYKENLNSPNEVSFILHKLLDPKKNLLWDKVKDLKVLYIPELQEKFEITVSDDISNTVTKSVTGLSLAESELSQILLRNIEINTDIDFENSLYDVNFPTVFCRDINDIDEYNDIWETNEKYTIYDEDGNVDTNATTELRKDILRHASLLHRILEKASNYTIDHVDETLLECNWIRSFSIDKQYIYDVLVGDISTEFGVLFKFNSMNRTVSAYDLYNTCNECGYRGDYESVCPKCGSTDLYGQHGEDTTVFVSSDCLAPQLSRTGDPSGVKTCFYIEGGDELMTAAVAALNPSGTSYIYNFSQDMFDEMPEEMVERIESYQNDYDYAMNDKEYTLTQEYVDDYNEIVTWLSNYYEIKYPTIKNPLVGYISTSELYYNLIDIESVLQTSLLPTITTDNPTIEESLDLIEDMLKYESESGVITEGTIAVSDPENCMPPSPAPDNAVLGMVKATINTALYKPEIIESTYGMFDGLYRWIGTIRLTSLEVGEGEIPETASREYTFTVTGDVETYMKQQIQKNMARVDVSQIMNLTSLDEKTTTDEWLNWFKEQLHFYSADALTQLQTEFRTCQQIIYDLQEKLDKELSTIFGDPTKHFYDIFTERLELVDAELDKRNSDIGKLHRLYEYNYQTNLADGELIRLRTEINNSLNLQKYLEGNEEEENYYPTFCGYIREDTYTNENYISTGLNNMELMDRAKELLEVAETEAVKSANGQYSISTTLANLYAIPEFAPLAEHFKVGNWIRVEFEDTVYRLRLLSYQINFDDLTNLEVEFSTALFSSLSSSEIQDILNSAKKISGSYNAVVKQVQKTTETANDNADKINGGINSSQIPITNDDLTQDIVIDKNGIWGRAYDDVEGKYDDCQFLFVNNRLVMTNDNWKSIYTSIGKFTYTEDGEEKTGYGVLADTIVGNFILGNHLKIQNENGTLSFDNDGLHVENAEKSVCVEINPNAENIFQISKDSTNTGNYTEEVMSVDNEGNGSFKGRIESESGSIGGWGINKDSISNTTNYSYNENGTFRDGTSSLILSSNEENNALEIITAYQEWYSTGEYQETCENKIEFTKDSNIYLSSYRTSDEGGTSIGNTWINAGGIKLSGISGTGSTNFEIALDGTGISCAFENDTVFSVGVQGGVNCTSLAVNNVPVSLEGHTHPEYAQYGELINETRTWASNSFLPITGGTIDGPLTVNSTLTSPQTVNETYGGSAKQVMITGGGRFAAEANSSKRYKHDIELLSNNDLDPKKLLDLDVVQYVYNQDYLSEDDYLYGKLVPGFIAEDVAENYPVAAKYFNGKVDDWNVRIIVPAMLKLIQDLYKKVEELKLKKNITKKYDENNRVYN